MEDVLASSTIGQLSYLPTPLAAAVLRSLPKSRCRTIAPASRKGDRMAHHFEKLRSAFAITVGGRLLPGAGGYSLGAITVAIAGESSAHAWLEQMAGVVASLGQGPAEVLPVGDPWKFMRRAAGEGIAGIQLMNEDGGAVGFMFMVRVEEAGAALPTVLASTTYNGWDACLTRAGVQPLTHADVLHWQRFDILDRVNGMWGQRCPFRGWNHGDLLYELRSENAVVLLADVPLLGHWNSTDGAFAFFTSREEADHYLQDHIRGGFNRILSGLPDRRHDRSAAPAGLRSCPVEDLRAAGGTAARSTRSQPGASIRSAIGKTRVADG